MGTKRHAHPTPYALNLRNSTAVLSQYDYRYDELGRRESVENSGTAFAQTRHNIYTYNDRNELTGSERKAGTMAAPAAVVDAEGRLYEYDPIGNRISATEGSAATTYTTDVTNRYTALSGGVSASPAYDDDGNMTAYNGATYTWNAENRLVSVEKADKKITFLYDYMGRRVRKKVFGGTPGSWNTVPDETRMFVYDGWNLIKETVTGDTGDTYYVWGPDLSQSMQGAGGIGGLVCSVSGTAVRHYTYDANGNVGQLVDEDGGIVARYEYDPFGNEIVAEGDGAQGNPFRFSTKYSDAETGLYYYGYRYYSAELGRWISRDPMGEEGGYNLYAFVFNNSINGVDLLGKYGIIEFFKKDMDWYPHEAQAAISIAGGISQILAAKTLWAGSGGFATGMAIGLGVQGLNNIGDGGTFFLNKVGIGEQTNILRDKILQAACNEKGVIIYYALELATGIYAVGTQGVETFKTIKDIFKTTNPKRIAQTYVKSRNTKGAIVYKYSKVDIVSRIIIMDFKEKVGYTMLIPHDFGQLGVAGKSYYDSVKKFFSSDNVQPNDPVQPPAIHEPMESIIPESPQLPIPHKTSKSHKIPHKTPKATPKLF